MSSPRTVDHIRPNFNIETGERIIYDDEQLITLDSREKRPVQHLNIPPASSGCCGMSKGGTIAFAVYMTATIALAIIGMLVCTGVLDISFVNVGPMTPDMGLYTMIAGLSGAVVGIVALMIAKCQCNKQKAESGSIEKSEKLAVEVEEESDSEELTWGQKFMRFHESNVEAHNTRMEAFSAWCASLRKSPETL